jgi:hypothetical protein
MGKVKEIFGEVMELAETDREAAAVMLIEKFGYKRDYAYQVIEHWVGPEGEQGDS